jgi:DNA-binding GntR family transcriptional regulator
MKSTVSLTAQVTERIRQAIIDGVHPLGEALSELKLADALGVSRTPVRDALMALQMQGLIDIRPQAGSYVFMPSEENVAELCEFRRVLELMALRLCFARRRTETLLQLRLACDAMDRAKAIDDRLAGTRGDSAFHEAIAQNSANEYLIGAYKLVSGRVAALRTHNLAGADNLREKSMSEHRAIMRAFAKGDLDRAESILDEHISRMHSGFRAARRRETSERVQALADDAASSGARRTNRRRSAPPPTNRPLQEDAQ